MRSDAATISLQFSQLVYPTTQVSYKYILAFICFIAAVFLKLEITNKYSESEVVHNFTTEQNNM